MLHTLGIEIIRWPVVWDLLAELESGLTPSDRASWKTYIRIMLLVWKSFSYHFIKLRHSNNTQLRTNYSSNGQLALHYVMRPVFLATKPKLSYFSIQCITNNKSQWKVSQFLGYRTCFTSLQLLTVGVWMLKCFSSQTIKPISI